MVGKAATKSIKELREFEIQDPWTEEKAKELGSDALGEWIAEQNSHDLDIPPNISKRAGRDLCELVDSIPLNETPFSAEQWATLRPAETN